MTDYLVRRTSKLLFPSLARDERKRLMRNILLVLVACVISAGTLSVWMLSASISGGHIIMNPDLSPSGRDSWPIKETVSAVAKKNGARRAGVQSFPCDKG